VQTQRSFTNAANVTGGMVLDQNTTNVTQDMANVADASNTSDGDVMIGTSSSPIRQSVFNNANTVTNAGSLNVNQDYDAGSSQSASNSATASSGETTSNFTPDPYGFQGIEFDPSIYAVQTAQDVANRVVLTKTSGTQGLFGGDILDATGLIVLEQRGQEYAGDDLQETSNLMAASTDTTEGLGEVSVNGAQYANIYANTVYMSGGADLNVGYDTDPGNGFHQLATGAVTMDYSGANVSGANNEATAITVSGDASSNVSQAVEQQLNVMTFAGATGGMLTGDVIQSTVAVTQSGGNYAMASTSVGDALVTGGQTLTNMTNVIQH
jgi:hypothetical protein